VSRETKIGLLVATGIILTFAFILQAQLAGEPLAPVEDNFGVQLSQQPLPQPQPQPNAGGGTIPPQRIAEGAADSAVPIAEGPNVTETPGGAVGESPEETGLFVVQRPLTGDERLAAGNGGEGAVNGGNGTGSSTETLTAGGGDVAPPAARTYTVAAGDSLYRIAEKEFGPGKGGLWQRIADANPELRDPRRLKMGMKLVIPALEPPAAPQPVRLADGETGPVPPQSPLTPPPAAAPRTYVVQAGDTLSTISQKTLGTSKKWELISKANGNVNPTSLRIGQALTIPQEPVEVAHSEGPALERALEEAAGFVSNGNRPTGIYRVQAGDSLYVISRRVLSSPDRWKEIYELNRDKMSSPNDLSVGQVILVPALERVAMTESLLQ